MRHGKFFTAKRTQFTYSKTNITRIWSDSVSNLSNKLQRESLRYVEAVQLADALGYEIVWQKRR